MDTSRAQKLLKSVDNYLSVHFRNAKAPIPSEAMCCKYGFDRAFFLNAEDFIVMMGVLEATGFSLGPGNRVLDFGCGIGRTLRHFFPLAQDCDIWGVDVRAEEIAWCRQNLSPPLHFATTTLHPRLPFEDRHFDLIYAMSVFTHIAELTGSWLMELHRALAKDGRLYVTIQDEHTVKILSKPHWKDHWVAQTLFGSSDYQAHPQSWTRLVLGIKNESLVFHALEDFLSLTEAGFKVLSVTKEAYGYQTGVLLQRKD